ncbi:MAG: sensor histidine kinase [Bacteroidales bacterium]|nr:sensor histidine kinase [Bacteroidales bacterium]MCF8389125.1 sensor histidine kinase [Bacteroidales bacterium]
MKSSTPRQLAFYLALIASVLFGGALLTLKYIRFNDQFVFIIIFAAIFFILIDLIALRIFNDFIFNKIQPIYKSIYKHAISQKAFKKQIVKNDMISGANMELENWVKTKAHEINKLKQIEEYRKDFLGNVSHELKTPIFNIQGYILTLLDGGLEDESINKLYLQRAEKSINRMISIVDDLESISHLESGEMALELEKFNIVKMTEEVFEALEKRARDHQISLTINTGGQKAIQVYGDRKRIFEVLSNLILNSINYGKKRGKTTVSFMDMGNKILIDVNDNGSGIAEKDIPRIFERFYRTDKARSREEGGTGLGLAIVKHVIEAHKQSISVRSKPGKGSSFVFTLKKA